MTQPQQTWVPIGRLVPHFTENDPCETALDLVSHPVAETYFFATWEPESQRVVDVSLHLAFEPHTANMQLLEKIANKFGLTESAARRAHWTVWCLTGNEHRMFSLADRIFGPFPRSWGHLYRYGLIDTPKGKANPGEIAGIGSVNPATTTRETRHNDNRFQ